MRTAIRLTMMMGALVLSAAPAATKEHGPLLTGSAAFGDWRADAPGTRRLITATDLPPPYATRSVGNAAAVRGSPSGTVPSVPDGFAVDLVADGLVNPRTLTIAPNGDIFVAESAAGRVTVIRPNLAGAPVTDVFAKGLNAPYGVAFYPPGPEPEWVYIGETGGVLRYPYQRGAMRAAGPLEAIVTGLPQGGHWTRDIVFSSDGRRLFVAVGSASNVAERLPRITARQRQRIEREKGRGATWGPEEDRAVVLSFNPDGSDPSTYATGIRNCSGITVQPATGSVWCATNERDGLGDNLPPDYATALREGGFYGWPWYYIGANEDPRHAGARPDLAAEVIVPDVLFQPHSAPLGIAFYTHDAFPAAYHGDAFVTLHGSWNSSERTGYKVVRLIMEDGVATGVYEDFMTGFVISDDRVWGRPVGVAVDADGSLLVSEDGNGTIWRVRATKP